MRANFRCNNCTTSNECKLDDCCPQADMVPFDEVSFGLGDVVSFGWKDGWDQATVNFVHPDGTVDLFRPYVQTADFSYTGGVICYIGIDTDNKKVDPSKLKLIRKGKPLR